MPTRIDIEQQYEEQLDHCKEELKISWDFIKDGLFGKGVWHLMRANGALGAAYGLAISQGWNLDSDWQRKSEQVEMAYEDLNRKLNHLLNR